MVMPRGRGRTRGTVPKSKARTSDVANGLNIAYRDMLAEAEADSSPIQTGDEERPIKRRRVRGRLVTPEAPAPSQLDPLVHKSPIGQQQGIQNQHLDPISANHEIETGSTADPSPRQQQLAYEDDTSGESDFAWEEVRLAQEAEQPILNAADSDNEQDLDLVLEDDRKHDPNQNSTARRKPLTALEKKMRLDVHKVHFLCLLYHVHIRNHWCNDQNLHKILYRRLPKPIVFLLNPNEKLPQFRQDEAFRQGLQEASSYFKDAFTITAQGMSRARWAESPESIPTQPPPDLELPLQKSDFLDCARKMQGSRDVGAQLFCALLRSCGVETRLVCSLQVLPLTSTTKGATPQKPAPKPLPIVDYSTPSPSSITTNDPPALQPSARPIGSTGGLTRFNPPTAFAPHPPRSQKPKPEKPSLTPSSPHPVFWLEAINPHTQKPTPLSPLTHPVPIKNPSTLAPPLSDPQNTLTYALAFAASLTAHDVTRRYTPSYLSKTLRARIDGAGDAPWLASVLTLFSHPSERKQREREEEDLARKAAREPMPRALADFHRHPIYALERHLRRHETLLPFARPIGRVSAGAGRGSENVFRRADVVPCRSAGQWLRLGRAIKEGEQAMKKLPLPPPSSSTHHASSPNEGIGTESSKPLYTEPQTKPYIPPPIPASGSPIPRNAYGSLDIYHPAMVPAGGHHATHPLTAHAARVLGIDAVDAVTGFTFSGKNKNKNKKAVGKPLVAGAIIFSAHREAVDAVIAGLEAVQRGEEEEARGRVARGWWRRLVVGLRVRERVGGYFGDLEEGGGRVGVGGGWGDGVGGGDDVVTGRVSSTEEKVEKEGSGDDGDGDGYVPGDASSGEEAVGRRRRRRRTAGHDIHVPRAGKRLSDHDDDEAGGFIIPDASGFDDGGGGGGFIPDDDDDQEISVGNQTLDRVTVQESQPTRVLNEEEEQQKRFTTTTTGSSSSSSAQQDEGGGGNIDISQPSTTGTASHQNARLTTAAAVDDDELEDVHHPAVPEGGRRGKQAFELPMTDAEVEEARTLQVLYENGAMDDGLPRERSPPERKLGDERVFGMEEEEEGGEGDELIIEANADRDATMVPHDGAEANPSPSEEDDKGSLISEDPDDEDAEPEWLP